MAIEKRYTDLIEEIKQNSDKLNDWESGFIFGDGESSPISERPELSISQKKTIEKIYRERVKGEEKRGSKDEIVSSNPRITAVKLETGSYQMAVDGEQMGPPISHKEAVIVTQWLCDAGNALLPGQPEEAKFPGE